MKFVATADLHLGETIPGIDRFKIIGQVFRFAVENKADFLIIAGDIYDHLMVSNAIRARFNRMLKKLSTDLEVIVFPGNHDVGKKTTALSPLKPFSDDRIRVVDKPSRFTRGGKRFLVIPYDIRMAQDPKHTLRTLKKYGGDYECVFGHLSISGVKVGPSNFALLGGVTKAQLRKYIGARFFILGHIHKPQKGGNIYYCGSPDYLDFGERDEEKRFLFYEDGELSSVPIKNRRLIQIEYTTDGIDRKLVRGAIYKIVVRCNKTDLPNMNVSGLVDKIKSKDGSVVKVSWEVASRPRRRAKEINFRDSLAQNVKRYVKRFGGNDRGTLLTMAKEVLDEASKDRNQ